MLKILDGSAGYGKALSEQDIKDFLTTKILNVHLGTVDESGHANIHPAWYYYDDSKEKIYQGIIRFTFASTILPHHIKEYVVREV